MEAVYLIKTQNDVYKIGVSKNLKSRLSELSIFPWYWELIWFIEADNARSIETEFHRCFNDKRIVGEWFKLTPEDVNTIKAVGVAVKDKGAYLTKVTSDIDKKLYLDFKSAVMDEGTTVNLKVQELIEQYVVKKKAGLI